VRDVISITLLAHALVVGQAYHGQWMSTLLLINLVKVLLSFGNIHHVIRPITYLATLSLTENWPTLNVTAVLQVGHSL